MINDFMIDISCNVMMFATYFGLWCLITCRNKSYYSLLDRIMRPKCIRNVSKCVAFVVNYWKGIVFPLSVKYFVIFFGQPMSESLRFE